MRRRVHGHGREHDGGFTLVETLIALVVAAGTLAVLQQGLASGWKGLGSVRGERGALEVARARLTSTGIEAPLVEGTSSGSTVDGFAWQVVTARAQADGSAMTRQKIVGYWVTATVTWRATSGLAAERKVTLTTFKLGSAPP